MEIRLRKLLVQLYKENMSGLPLDKSKVFESKEIVKDMLDRYIETTKESECLNESEKKESIDAMERLKRELDKEGNGLVKIDQVLHTMHNMEELSATIGYSLPMKVKDWLHKIERG